MTEEIKSELEIIKKIRSKFLNARRLADKAALDHAFMMRAYACISRLSDASWCWVVDHKKI